MACARKGCWTLRRRGLIARLFEADNAGKIGLLGRLTGGSLVAAKTLILVRLLGMIGKVGSCTKGRITLLLLSGTTPPLPAYTQLEGRAALLSPTADRVIPLVA